VVWVLLRKSKHRDYALFVARSVNRSAQNLKALRSATAKAVATVLAKAREQRNLSQRDLALLLKRPHSVVGMIESNQRQVNVPEFFAIAEALKVDPMELFRQVVRERDLR
jgi:ribosome-binding protein aMBF1 (putative translation factor)